MNGKLMFEAVGYVDDRYLDMVDDFRKESNDMKKTHSLKRKTLMSLLAAVICISLLAATAVATGWGSGLFRALKEKYPQDQALFEAAAEANTEAVPEIAVIPQLDPSKLVLLERYFDGETILLGYDLEKILPDPAVGIEPEEELLAEIRSGHRASRIAWDGFDPGDKVLNTKKAEQYNMTEDAFVMDRVMQGSLSAEEYDKAWSILEKKGWVCIAVRDVYIGDTILVDGHDLREEYNSETNAYASRTEYESELGNCLRLDPLPEAVKNQEKVTVTLTVKSNVQYLYLDMDGNGRIYFDSDSVEAEEISFELERTEKNG